MQRSLKVYKNTYLIVAASLILEAVLFYLYYFPETKLLAGDEVRYWAQAKAIAKGGEWHTHLFWPPMQSLLLAGFIKVFGETLIPIQVFQYLLILATAWIVRDLTYQAIKCRESAQVGFFVVLTLPSWLVYSQFIWPEAVHVFLFSVTLWVNYCRKTNLRWLLISGFCIGLALLFKSFLLLFVPFLFWPSLQEMYKNQMVKQGLFSIATQVFVMMLVISPVMIQSKKLYNTWMVSDSSSFNLHVGLLDSSRSNFRQSKAGLLYQQYMDSADTYEEREAIVKEKITQIFEEKGFSGIVVGQLKKQYFRLFDYGSFLSYQFAGDGKAGQLSRFSHKKTDWIPRLLLGFDRILYTICLITVFFILFFKSKNSSFNQQLLLFVLYTLGLFLFLHIKTRFRIPWVPVYAVCLSQFYFLFKNQKLVNDFKSKIGLLFITVFVLFMTSSSHFLDRHFPL